MLDQVKMKKIQAEMAQKKHKQKGAGMIEYALVAAAVVALGVAFFGTDGKSGTIGKALTDKMTSVATDIKGS